MQESGKRPPLGGSHFGTQKLSTFHDFVFSQGTAEFFFCRGRLQKSHSRIGFASIGGKIPERQPRFRENPLPGQAFFEIADVLGMLVGLPGVAEIRAALGLEQGLWVCLRF